jgi:5'-3' exonuclease
MGIPSYYKRLVDRFPKLVQKGIRQMKSDVLLMDFNCLIYQCVRSDTLPKYTGEGRDDWERALIEAVKKYTVNVWNVAGKPSQVLIAVDGVVPMAKIRQQRLRRFKSRWMAGIEREAGVRKAGEEVWDTNAITPGTEFMEKLGVGLRSLAAARPGWTVSCAAEAGEGEQKVMAWVRCEKEKLAGKSVIVYGLDADLIVLSLLAVARDVPNVTGWSLLRELAEFEGGRADGGAFGSLNIRELLGILVPPAFTPADYMLEYACGMSFLGNDFLPHSLSVKMREGGHDLLCRTLVEIHSEGGRLIGPGEKVVPSVALELVRRWAKHEEQSIADNFDHKYKTRPMPPRNDRERMMIPYERLPLEWREEAAIWNGKMLPQWREEYRRKWMHGAAPAQTVRQYVTGLQWIIDYYLGKPISYSWYFPWNVPPLWGDLEAELLKGLTAPPEPVTPPVAPPEQLAMVLPMDSWWLVRDPLLRAVPSKLPAYWPKRFGFFSVGRRWLWECEAELPILTAARLRGT